MVAAAIFASNPPIKRRISRMPLIGRIMADAWKTMRRLKWIKSNRLISTRTLIECGGVYGVMKGTHRNIHGRDILISMRLIYGNSVRVSFNFLL
jgi:hypothetical protein